LSLDGGPQRRSLVYFASKLAEDFLKPMLRHVLVELHHANVFFSSWKKNLNDLGRILDGNRENSTHGRI
jgi:hypothetical protein